MGRSFWISVASLVFAGVTAAILLEVPSHTFRFEHRATRTLAEINGPHAILPVMLPVVLALVPVLFPARMFRIAAAILMGAITLIGAFTIGLFYLPASLLMVIAAWGRTPQQSEA